MKADFAFLHGRTSQVSQKAARSHAVRLSLSVHVQISASERVPQLIKLLTSVLISTYIIYLITIYRTAEYIIRY